jgi:hypothetical protein
MPIAVVARAVGMFAIGTTEFVIVGLLPTIAGHLHVSSRDRRSHPDRPSDLRAARRRRSSPDPPGPRHLHDGTASRSTWPLAALRGARGRYQAFVLLRIAFTVAPIAFGRAKFFNVRVDWPNYLAAWINDVAPGSGQDFMYLVGGVEMLAGVLVA